MAKADHGGEVVQRHTQARFAFDLDAQGVVVQAQPGVGQGDVEGVEQLYGGRQASGSNRLRRAAAKSGGVAWGWQRCAA